MRKAIFATLDHARSTDAKPRHTKCPIGTSSWCYYNRALPKKELPGPHKTNLHTTLREDIVAEVMPVYQRLANDALLGRCLGGKTQNANESLHSTIWKRCPKIKFVSRRKIEIGAAEAIGNFNQGCWETLKRNMLAAGLSPESRTAKKAQLIDKKRVKKSVYKQDAKQKHRRQVIKLATIRQEESSKAAEGNMYGSGQF